jgi:hypothetical protein
LSILHTRIAECTTASIKREIARLDGSASLAEYEESTEATEDQQVIMSLLQKGFFRASCLGLRYTEPTAPTDGPFFCLLCHSDFSTTTKSHADGYALCDQPKWQARFQPQLAHIFNREQPAPSRSQSQRFTPYRTHSPGHSRTRSWQRNFGTLSEFECHLDHHYQSCSAHAILRHMILACRTTIFASDIIHSAEAQYNTSLSERLHGITKPLPAPYPRINSGHQENTRSGDDSST